MRRNLIALACLTLAVLGLAAGLLSAPARADGPVQLADLPALGYVLGIRADLSIQPICSNYWVLSGNGAPETLIGDPAHAYCQSPAEMQSRIDALLAAFPPPVPAPVAPPAADPVPAAPAAPVATTATTDTTPAPAPVTTTDTAPTVTDPASAPAEVSAAQQETVAAAPVSTASQDALVAAQDSGAPADVAALAARSAGENAVYAL